MQKFIKQFHLSSNDIFNFNDEFLKINPTFKGDKNGKLIVVTSINPTPEGEGKTSLLLGIVDAMNKFNKKTIGCLREPSIGPVFGLKGTATGGNESTLKNSDKINLHFTGDFHAITTANNLISAIIDNEIFFNSNLNIDPSRIIWKRCIDMNDRSLREIEIKINKNIHYKTGFNITAASDLMALFCLAKFPTDFRTKISNTIIAFSKNNNPIKIKDLQIENAIMKILNDAFWPNLTSTKYESPVLIHGGPFANIAHGCNSIIATRLAKTLANYVITECGFGSDLGFEKFMNIKMQNMNIFPDLAIVCATIKAIKYHGSAEKDINNELESGFKNLVFHVEHIRKYGIEPLVVLNIHKNDTKNDIIKFATLAKVNGIQFSFSEIYNQGPATGELLVKKILKMIDVNKNKKNYLYNVTKDNISTKIEKVCKQAYGAKKITIAPKVKEIIKKRNLQDYYICIAKTPYSLSSDATKINVPNNIEIKINDVEINYAAKTIVLICDKIYRMPGLNQKPKAKKFMTEKN